ncbi:hypothetical protein NM688_g7490 [Phlebia brevispora]|uniref:Uncharacterized protein n=1 Tax=Phlebia brevispora TaxID=194682 RepID=A0ACC1S4V4_9APHY|nr:hypothetical protein NM688_g7490 [Phlebia brevispora]
MPLRYTEDPASLDSVKHVPEQYIIFYSSRDKDGKLWCPVCIAPPAGDCRNVEKRVEQKFAGSEDGTPSALIVFVGQRPAWKSPSNPFRGEPWKVGSVPTIIRLKDGARLEDEMLQGLETF